MALLKRSDWPSTVGGSLLSDFFDDRFVMPHWMREESMPALNIKENEKNYEIELAVPGYNKSDIQVSLEKGILTISAETQQEARPRIITDEENLVVNHFHGLLPYRITLMNRASMRSMLMVY